MTWGPPKALTFDEWNRQMTALAAEGASPSEVEIIQQARRGLRAKRTLWPYYLADAKRDGWKPEAFLPWLRH